MKVLVNDGDIFDVEVQPNGDWKFFWTEEGFWRLEHWDHTYTKEQVRKFLIELQAWTIIADEETEVVTPDNANIYAAAFNMWQDDYLNNPQAYESAYDTALNHLKEKLEGKEPTYGNICAKMLQEYLEKVK